uniref:Uncharacterized protein n=1 Tax=Panagrolaimus superbus TaxID=310955 RepID=A0A914Y562_9BILA
MLNLCYILYLFNYLILVYAVTPTPTINPSQQCPCITVPGMPGCLQFDSRLQATTLDEAMNSFTDLTLEESQKVEEEKNDIDCTTKQCKTCKEYLKKKLKDIGMLPASTITSLTANSTVQCSKYNFVRKGDVGKDSSDDDDEDDDSSGSSVEIKEIEKLKGKRDKIMKKIEDHKRHLKRIRRQASAATDMGVDATVMEVDY